MTVPDPTDQVPVHPRRPARCLRHHVWMAACGQCREARAALLTNGSEGTPAGRLHARGTMRE
jgi:hypothetical protein